MGRPRKDMAGQTFGRLAVLGYSHSEDQPIWDCVCECGRRVLAPGYKLRSGRKRSCGCLEKENSREFVKRGTTHGLKNHPLYWRHKGMMARCYRKESVSYPRYGGRGIRVCESWHDFESFFSWAMDNGWKPELSIDRIDNDGNYEPDNCRFVGAKAQCNNRSNNRRFTWRGRTMTLAQWSREVGIKRRTLEARIVADWPMDRVFTESVWGR